MGVKMIWPHDRTGLSLISPDLSQNKAARRRRATERKETLTQRIFGCFVEPIRTKGAGRMELRLASNGEVSRGADPCGGLGGESHCHQALMGPKIPQLTKTCETIGKRKTFVIQIGPLGAPP